MKTASMLFGLVVSTAGVAHASPRVDANGDVACGNAMSKGGDDDTCTVRTAATTPTPVVTPGPTLTHRTQTAAKLVIPRAPIVRALVLSSARPLADSDGDMACGNVMTKGGHHHVCHEKTAQEAAVDPVLAAFYAPPVKSTR